MCLLVIKLVRVTYVVNCVRMSSLSVSYCMVCAYVREYNPRAIASGLSPVHMHNHTIISRTYAQPYNNCLIAPACMCTLCIVRYLMQNIEISLKGAIRMFNTCRHTKICVY